MTNISDALTIYTIGGGVYEGDAVHHSFYGTGRVVGFLLDTNKPPRLGGNCYLRVRFDSGVGIDFEHTLSEEELQNKISKYLSYEGIIKPYRKNNEFRCQAITTLGTQCSHKGYIGTLCRLHYRAKENKEERCICECGRIFKNKSAIKAHKHRGCLYDFDAQATWIKLIRFVVATDLGLVEKLNNKDYADICSHYSAYEDGFGMIVSAKYLWEHPERFYDEDELFEVACNRSKWRDFIALLNHVLGRIDYKEYITSPEWKITAQKAKERAGFKCAICNSSKQLNVHHKTYERLGRELDEDLIVLCHDCHEIFHHKLKERTKQ